MYFGKYKLLEILRGRNAIYGNKTKTKKKSVVDSAARNAASITDGCNPEFVKGASFDRIFEMPIITVGLNRRSWMARMWLVGAITHVFINDPTKGYGIFVEEMMKQKRGIYEIQKYSLEEWLSI